MNIEFCRWIDSGIFLGEDWEPIARYIERARNNTGNVETVGFNVYEDDRVLVLATSHDPDHDNLYGAQAIHKANILERRTL